MTSIAGITSLTTPQRLFLISNNNNLPTRVNNHPTWNKLLTTRITHIKPLRASGPEAISEKVVENIKEAEEACAGDPVSGECVAAWDTVEELSAAASHARDKNKNSDPLETYCKDNPETDECRTYDN